MGLILKDGVQKLMVGYPTVSDKYNVGPAVLEGTHEVYPGDLVLCGSKSAAYKSITDGAGTENLGGFVVATNVHVPTAYPAPVGPVPFKPGEAFGILADGYIAIALDSGAVLADAIEGAIVYLTSGYKCTTVSTSNTATKCTFTGVTELQGSTKVAEIFVPNKPWL